MHALRSHPIIRDASRPMNERVLAVLRAESSYQEDHGGTIVRVWRYAVICEALGIEDRYGQATWLPQKREEQRVLGRAVDIALKSLKRHGFATYDKRTGWKATT